MELNKIVSQSVFAMCTGKLRAFWTDGPPLAQVIQAMGDMAGLAS